MLRIDKLRDWSHFDDFAIRQSGDPIADGAQTIQVVRDHKNSEAQRLLSVLISTSKSLAEIGSSP